MSHGALATCLMEPSQHVPWSPRNMSHGALAAFSTCLIKPLRCILWSHCNMSHLALVTCPKDPRNMSHGSSQHVLWTPCSPVPWTPHDVSRGALATCQMEASHVTWSPRCMSHHAIEPLQPLQHVSLNPCYISHEALPTCPMKPSQHVTWSPRNMSH